MRNKKVIIASVALGVLLLAAVVGAGAAVAKSTSSYPPIVQKLADKFNANPDEVKGVFEQAREERRQEAQARFEEQLNKAVEDGKITKEQKEVILKKEAEIQKKQEEVQELRQELKTWVDENNIDLGQFSMCGPRGPRGGGFSPGPGW